jgi:hypothetical protein
MTPVFAPAKSLFAPRTKRMLECSIFSLAPGREQKPSCQRVRSHGDCEVQPVLFAEQTTTIVRGLDGLDCSKACSRCTYPGLRQSAISPPHSYDGRPQ